VSARSVTHKLAQISIQIGPATRLVKKIKARDRKAKITDFDHFKSYEGKENEQHKSGAGGSHL
jgi:hypothetical protein